MDAKALVQEAFLAAFAQPGRNNVGVELEFPLLNKTGGPVDEPVAHGLLEYFLARGFHVEEYDGQGQPAFIKNAQGDELSFDNSYNNFEFALEKAPDLCTLHRRFVRLYTEAQAYLLPQGHTLCGLGANPNQSRIQAAPVPHPVYGMVRSFLSQFSGGNFHTYPAFPAYISSAQTHLDIALRDLPRALTLFAALDFVRALLFSNSLPFQGMAGYRDAVCVRDMLWEKSGFGSLADNVGKVEGRFATPEDITDALLHRSIFNRVRDGRYELFAPVSLQAYFSQDNPAGDIEYYLSFKNVEVTRRGTLEVRSDCTQPVRDAFAPAAFSLGLASELEEAEHILYGFLDTLPPALAASPHRNALLRDAVIYRWELPAAAGDVARLLCALVGLAERGLKRRGKGEEALLSPLFNRAETLTCPALTTRRMLERGIPWTEIIHEHAALA